MATALEAPPEEKGGKTQAMARYGEKSQAPVKQAMEKMKKGKLKSGRSGKTARNPKQAIAIGLSEARKKGAKVPPAPRGKEGTTGMLEEEGVWLKTY